VSPPARVICNLISLMVHFIVSSLRGREAHTQV